MSRPKTYWLIPIAILILLSFFLPFTLLTNIDAWYGSLLFWIVATILVIAISALISSDWKD